MLLTVRGVVQVEDALWLSRRLAGLHRAQLAHFMTGTLVMVGNGIAVFAGHILLATVLPVVVAVGGKNFILGADQDSRGLECFQYAADRSDAFRV
jgi:hypothetical protein